MTAQIGLRDLLKQLREELTEDTSQPKVFFIDGVEIELQVAIKREGSGNVKISVLQFAGIEGGASSSLEKGHKITLQLRPLMTYDEARQQLKGEPTDLAVRLLTKDPH